MRILLSIALLFVVNLFLEAQVHVGFKGGLSLANQNYKSAPAELSTNVRRGIHFGFFSALKLSDNIGIQPELLYTQKGSELTAFEITSENDINYVELPVLFRYSIYDILSFHAGPQIGFLFSGAAQDDSRFSYDYRLAELSIVIGAQVDLPFGIIGGLRYNHGISSIVEDDGVNGEVFNRVFQLYLGYKILNR